MEISRLTRDGTAESVSQDQFFRREWGHGISHFSCSELTTSRIGNLTRLILTLAICDNHIYIHSYLGAVFVCFCTSLCVRVFITLRITAQSGPVILVILCYLR